jgi:hypothetical protein
MATPRGLSADVYESQWRPHCLQMPFSFSDPSCSQALGDALLCSRQDAARSVLDGIGFRADSLTVRRSGRPIRRPRARVGGVAAGLGRACEGLCFLPGSGGCCCGYLAVSRLPSVKHASAAATFRAVAPQVVVRRRAAQGSGDMYASMIH